MLDDTVTMRCSVGAVGDYPDHAAEWGDLEAVARLWAGPAFREAVLLASPVLAAQADKLVSSPGDEAPLKTRKRVHKALLKYALRMSSRCTPFGTFAGLALLPVGDGEPVLGTSHTRHVRASGAVTRRMLHEARAMPNARLYPNPAVIERADRFVVTVMRGVDDTHTRAAVRATGPARLALDTAVGTAARHMIEQRIVDAYPAAGLATVGKLVDELLAAEVLLCEAEHSAFDADPLARMPDSIEGVAQLRAAIARYAGAADPVADGSLAALLRLCAAGDLQRDIHVDLELDLSGQVPASVVTAAHDAIAVLGIAMAHTPGPPALDQFSAEFVERYGNTLVPFLTVVDEELGIGYPVAYDAAVYPTDPADDPAADRRRDLIAELLQRAASHSPDTVELTDADLAGFPEPDGMPGSVDVMLRLHRGSAGLRATVTGLGLPGGSAIGRFTSVMPEARDFAQRCVQFDSSWWAGRTGGQGIVCGIDYIAGTDSVNEIAATAPLYPAVLAVNARPHHRAGLVLTLADVYLGYADGQMRIVLADGTPLCVRQLNMATTRASAKAVRLLRDICDSGTRVPYWSWGQAEAVVNRLPAVRYRGVILAEQRWRYPGAADHTRIAVQDWLAATGVSRYVRVGPYDNQLHLDTLHPGHLDLLLDEIVAGNRWVVRAPTPEQMGVVADGRAALHSAEVVVTVAVPTASRVGPALIGQPLHDPRQDQHRLLMPGGEWTAFAITAARHTHDRIVQAFAAAFPGLLGRWYFVRYRDNDRDQLRVRVRRPVGELADVLGWLADARMAGRIGDYAIPVYHRELERYGGPGSFPCYERLFCLETAHIVAVLPLVGAVPPAAAGSPQLLRSGIDAAAGIVSQWLNSLDPSRVNTDEVIDIAVENYSRELGAVVHKIKTALRQQHPRIGAASGALAAGLREFWADPAQADAVLTPGVLQSASHLLCNRLGLQRHEEYAAMWLVKTERNRLQWHEGKSPFVFDRVGLGGAPLRDR
nr:Nisin biosynthesis protein NisB [Mycolicibacterium sp.]